MTIARPFRPAMSYECQLQPAWTGLGNVTLKLTFR